MTEISPKRSKILQPVIELLVGIPLLFMDLLVYLSLFLLSVQSLAELASVF